MSGDFLPDYDTMPLLGQYVGLWKLQEHHEWRQVRENGRPKLMPSRKAALESAKDCVRAILNPPVRVEQSEKTGEDLVMDAQVARLQLQAAQQRETFGSVIVKGKAVSVEVRRGKRA